MQWPRFRSRWTGKPATIRVPIGDTGCGIDRDERVLVTQRFYRTRRSREADREGSGLGLAIAHEIAALHSTTLRLSSRPGEGTTVIFDVPARRHDAAL